MKPRGRIAEQRHCGERKSESAKPDQNSQGRIQEEIDHESQVNRPDIPLDGRVVGGIDHKICERPNKQNRVQSIQQYT